MKTQKNKARDCAELFLRFARIGLFTFGGGYAMLPLIHADVVEKKKWVSDDDMIDMLAISESTPGPFAINAATFVGRRVAGVLGAVCATVGVALPSLLIIIAVSFAFNAFRDNLWVDCAFRGIRAGVFVLITNAVIKLGKKLDWSLIGGVLALAAFAIAVFTELSVIYVILAAGIVGICVQLSKKEEK